MKKLILSVVLAVVLSLNFVVLPAHAAGIGDIITQITGSSSSCNPSSGLQGGVSCTANANGFAKAPLSSTINTIINVLLMAVGIISVIMIIIGGIRYALSGGDEGAVKAAKDTILYAVVGLVVAILAFAIVNFVLKIFFA